MAVATRPSGIPRAPSESARSGRALVSVLLPNLGAGGAERMRIRMAELWLEAGLDVEFVVLEATGQLMPLLPAGCTLVSLDCARLRGVLSPLVGYLRKRRPDVLLAALWPLTTIAALAGRLTATRVAVSEHGMLSVAYAKKGRVQQLLLRSTLAVGFRLADVRIGVSNGVVEDVRRLALMRRQAYVVVNNPAATSADGSPSETPAEFRQLPGPVILSVGTLKAVKNQALLIDAFARLDRNLGATLCILGEGELRQDLEAQVARLGLRDRVLLPGFRANTRDFYASALVFALASDHEGFGNVLVEALQAGLSIVSTDCPSGPREILADGRYGRLVPVRDAAALAQALADALRAPVAERQELIARSKDFLVDTIAHRYLELMLPDLELTGRKSEASLQPLSRSPGD